MTTTTTTPKDTGAPPASRSSTNVNVSTEPTDRSIWTANRVIALVFTVLEVLLLVRFDAQAPGSER
jgi:hypothetical protein